MALERPMDGTEPKVAQSFSATVSKMLACFFQCVCTIEATVVVPKNGKSKIEKEGKKETCDIL